MNHKSILSLLSRLIQYLCLTTWLLIVLTGVGAYFLFPDAFTATNIATFLEQFQSELWLIYILLSALRGFSLLPSTPLVLSGTLLFPFQPWTVLAVSVSGILFSSSMIYFFSDYLGFTTFFENRKPELIKRIKEHLNRPMGFLFVTVWSFFPLVPTDLVCYVGGTTKMNFTKFIWAIFIGELVLCSVYIFFGGAVLNLVR